MDSGASNNRIDVSEPMNTGNLHKRQQRKACDTCRRRKVRCDIEPTASEACSGCRRAGIECISTTEWVKPKRRRRQHHQSPHQQDIAHSEEPQSASEQEPRRNVAHSVVAAGSSPNVETRSANPSLLTTRNSLMEDSPNAPPVANQHVALNSEDDIFQRQQFARSSLANFFKHGIDADRWAFFDNKDSFRIAYIGTGVSNLYHLVDLHSASKPRPLSSVNDTALDSMSTGGLSTRPLHYPYPPIRPNRSWKPSSNSLWPSSAPDLATEVASFPAPEVRDALISAYFQHVHPILPVISMPEFLEAYRTPDKPPPLLLFQTVLMAGAHACSHPLVANDRHTVKSILFQRASLLFHARYETNRMHLMQAAILFTWHIGDGDTVSEGPWYWSGIAIRLGCGLGAHRHSGTLPPLETSQYKRSWWGAFVMEVLSSLETGRPCAIRAEDVDQLPLEEGNMIDAPVATGEIGNTLNASIEGLDISPAESSFSPDYLNRMVELAYIGLDIMAAMAPSQTQVIDFNSINARLGRWSLRSGIFSTQKDGDAMNCHLRLHYNLMLLHLYRNFENNDSPTIRSTAAQTIVASIEKISSLGCLCQCQFTAVSALTAAGIQLAHELRSASKTGGLLVLIHVLDQLSRLLECATLLSKYWPNAEAVRTVFQDVHQKYEGYAEQGMQGEAPDLPESQPDWSRLLGEAQTFYHENFDLDQDWLNMSTWPGLG